MRSGPHQMNIGWPVLSSNRTVTRRLCGHLSGDPSEELFQSYARISAPISPPPAKKSSPDRSLSINRPAACTSTTANHRRHVESKRDDLLPQQQRVAAGLAGRGIAAREHIVEAVVAPFVARQMLDHDGTWPQRLRRFRKEADQHTVFIAFNVDLERIDVRYAGNPENPQQPQPRDFHAVARLVRPRGDMAGAAIV